MSRFLPDIDCVRMGGRDSWRWCHDCPEPASLRDSHASTLCSRRNPCAHWIYLRFPLGQVSLPGTCRHQAVICLHVSPPSTNLTLTCAFQNNQIGRTIGIETSSQNVPVAMSVILLSFQDAEVKISVLCEQAICTIF